MKKVLTTLFVLLLSLSLFSCGSTQESEPQEPQEEEEIDEITYLQIILDDNRTIDLELYYNVAPITVTNFLKLVDDGFYDGVVFHRIIAGFMIQTGGYYLKDNTIYQKSAGTIKGEFSANGVENDLKHEAGVISMARANDPDSASSQFFICSDTSPHLDGNYAAFGKVRNQESLDVVVAVSKVQTINIGYGFTDFPATPITIKTIIRQGKEE